MNWKDLLVFGIGVSFPILYYRICLALFSNAPFQEMTLRKWTGLNLHHMHLGFALVILAQLLLLANAKRQWCLLIGCLGIGFILDEFSASLHLPNIPRSQEMKIYRNTGSETFIILALVIAVAIGIVILKKPKC